MDQFLTKTYKMFATAITGQIFQPRFRWFEALYADIFWSITRYLIRPCFMTRYLTDMLWQTFPTMHLACMPKFVNRIFFSEEPELIDPPDLCPGNCAKKKCCKHIDTRVNVYINGSYTNREIHCDTLRTVSNMFKTPCFGFYNPTSGILVDTLHDFMMRFTCINGYKAHVLLDKMIYLTNKHPKLKEIVIMAHGSGGLVAEKFLNLLRERKYDSLYIYKFKFVLIGTPVCNMKWTRDCNGKLVSITGSYLYERTNSFGQKICHKAYKKSKFYSNLCCPEDHSQSTPYPYIESIWNTNDLIARAGVGNTSKLVQSDMVCIDGVKIEICDKYGHYNYYKVDDSNYKKYCLSYLARDYCPNQKYDTCTKY